MEDRFIKLTNAVYNLLEYFPETDPLKNRAKSKALAIMDNLTLVSGDKTCQIIEDIALLLNYFKLAELQGQLSKLNCLIISNEYEKLKKEIGTFAESIELTQKLPNIDVPAMSHQPLQEPASAKASARQGPPSHPPSPKATEGHGKITARQGKILDFLQKNEKAQVMDLKAVLPDVTKRTIRRDLDELLEAGKIDRFGEFNQVFYKMS